MKITVGHTPDADDAFMFYALLNNKIDTGRFSIVDTLEPIAVLNKKAERGVYDVTALSAGYFPSVCDSYDILNAGACMAETQGPLLIRRKNATGNTIAVPGLSTTAYIALKLFLPDCICVVVPYNNILTGIAGGQYDGGVLINEDQLCYDAECIDVTDLGGWWCEKSGLPMPLGIDIVRKEFPEEIKRNIKTILRDSIQYALEHEDEAIEYASSFIPPMALQTVKVFVKTYVNSFALDLGDRGRDALRCFYSAAYQAGLIASCEPNFIL